MWNVVAVCYYVEDLQRSHEHHSTSHQSHLSSGMVTNIVTTCLHIACLLGIPGPGGLTRLTVFSLKC